MIRSATALIALVALSSPAFATDRATDEGGGTTGTVHAWFPAGDFYPPYIADPLRPQNALTIQYLLDTEIPDTTEGRFGLRLGGAFGIFRWYREDRPDLGWQLTFEGGFAGQFDLGYSWDNTGWDGMYGLYLAWKPTSALGFRLGMQHNSTHVGDEYWNRVGRPPIHYTREEGVLGAAWHFRPRWTAYSEVGYGNGHVSTVTLRFQAGIQFVSVQRFWKSRASWFAAADVRTYQESDWRTRATAQVGYKIPVGNRGAAHRFAVEFGTGRTVMGQFNELDETWLGIGWYYDF